MCEARGKVNQTSIYRTGLEWKMAELQLDLSHCSSAYLQNSKHLGVGQVLDLLWSDTGEGQWSAALSA